MSRTLNSSVPSPAFTNHRNPSDEKRERYHRLTPSPGHGPTPEINSDALSLTRERVRVWVRGRYTLARHRHHQYDCTRPVNFFAPVSCLSLRKY
jgi:hypothetical protein